MSTDYNADPSEEQRNTWSKEQNELKRQLIVHDDVDFDPTTLNDLKYIAGVDLSFPLNDHENAIACLIVMEMPSLQIVYRKFLHTKLHLPYIAGYLAFREVEPLLQLLKELEDSMPEIYPQIILVDGNGLLHPRQFGIASHLGVLSQTPTIGIAKNFLVIDHELTDMHKIKDSYKKVLLHKGDTYLLQGETSQCIYGAAVRTSEKAPNPVFISQGHRISLQSAIHIVLATCPNYRIPEPIRAADLESRNYIRKHPTFTQK